MRNAAVYARISQDTAGEELGVSRQRVDCERFVASREWRLAEVFVDNDCSAFSGRTRPAYARMMAAVDAGEVDAIVAWHPDRLHRSPRELEDFIDSIERNKTTVATVTAGDFDLSTGDGRFMARILGSVARKESEDKSRRIRRKHLELAENGQLSGGGHRPFGYEADRLTIRRDEAALIRQATKRILAGESVRSIVTDWKARQVPTITGAQWSTTTVKRLLMSGRISGQREHHGEITGSAAWPAIITPEQTVRLRAILTDPKRDRALGVAARSYLLTGFVYCGRPECGARMTTRPVTVRGKYKYHRYNCAADRGGCDRCGIAAEHLEEMITEFVFEAVDHGGLQRHLDAVDTERDSEVLDTIAADEAKLVELTEMWDKGEISRIEWSHLRDKISERLGDNRALLATASTDTAAERYAGKPGALRRAWPKLTLEQKRAVIAAVVDKIVIAPTTRGTGKKFDPERVDVRWRV